MFSSKTRGQWGTLGALTGSVIALMAAAALIPTTPGRAQGQQDESESLIERGFAIAPVPLNLEGKNRALVGLGSYIVNAQALCNDCHTWHPFAHNPPGPGGNPFREEPEQLNTGSYMAGGRPVAPVPASFLDLAGNNLRRTIYSRNLTPDAAGLPAGLTFEEFRQVMRTGQDFDTHDPAREFSPLQVMPWPIYRKMTDRDLRAIYEYLSAIPHAEPDYPIPNPLP